MKGANAINGDLGHPGTTGQGFGEVEPAGVEVFAGGVVVSLAGRGIGWRAGRRVGLWSFGDQSSAPVVKFEVAGDVGVADHGELTAMVGIVVV